jgi:hypothetical protein
MEVVGPGRRPLSFAETDHTRRLLHVVERDLPALDGRTHDVDGRIVGVNIGRRTDVSALRVIRSLEVAEFGVGHEDAGPGRRPRRRSVEVELVEPS